jgi:2',3'-cyclic-nucleotide 2'-phosphodiesterase (5'-nucleotidase family)
MRRAPFIAALALAACTVSTNAPTLQGQDVHLTVLHTADVHSRILPYNFTPNKFDQLDGLVPDLAPFGGAARMSTLLQRERSRSSRVIHLDSGDCFQGAPIFNAFAGAAEMQTMSALGVDAAALGNHEFDKGPLNLASQIKVWAGFPIMAANYTFKDPDSPGDNMLGALIKPYTILDVDGLKVGVIGMGNVSAISQLVQGENSLGIQPLDTDQTIEYYSALLRPQVDVLVAVSHLGLEDDETTATTNQGEQAQTASQVRGDVDVVFGGHLHIVLNPPKQIPIFVNGVQTKRQTVLVHSGAFAKTIGRLDLVVHVNTPDEMKAQYDEQKQIAQDDGDPVPQPRRGFVKAYDYTLLPVTARQPVDGQFCVSPDEDASGQACTPDPKNVNKGFCRAPATDGSRVPCDLGNPSGPTSACPATGDQCLPCVYCHIPEDGKVLQIVEPYALAMNSSSKFQLTRTFANDALPAGILRRNTAGGDSQLGNIVATAMRLQTEVQADFSMTNSLGIRADFSTGPLSIEELYNVFPFDNTIEIIYLSGKEVQEMFDFISSKSASRGCITQGQISGAAFVMDCSVPPHLPDGTKCDPAQYIGSENQGLCYEGAADLILIGSQKKCATNADCASPDGKNNEICGASLGTCLTSDLVTGTRAVCTLDPMNPQSTCASMETCVASHLNVCGRVLNPFGDYRVAVNDYVANGGSGFTMLQFNTAKYNTGISLRDAVVDYLQRLDDPQFEGAYSCTGTPSADTCRGAVRCNDSRFSALTAAGTPVDPYLNSFNAITPDLTFRFCPGKATVGDCFGNMVCVLPHNQGTDGRIHPRSQ